jgi:hypothetical protein
MLRKRERAGKSGRPDAGSPDRGGAHERFRDFFRYARQDEQELSGGADGVERVEVQSVACDVRASPGSEFSYAIRGRWDEDTRAGNKPAGRAMAHRLRAGCRLP